MKVTIDTKEDSYEDLQKVVHLLTTILERKGSGVAGGPPVDTSNLMGMFNEPMKDSPSDSPPDFSSFLNLTGKVAEKKGERPQVEVY